MGIDLHIHTTYSDGDTTPAGIVELAVTKNLKAIAITDHDIADGVAEAEKAGEQYGIRVICGIELSTHWKTKSAHLLGYFFDNTHKELLEMLQWIQGGRNVRNQKILERLETLSMPITLAEVEKIAGAGLVGRPHIAQAMVKKGFVKSIDKAFAVYLGVGGEAYVKRRSINFNDAVAVLHSAGGAAVLAHPYSLGYQAKELVQELSEMADNGLDGIEVYYPKHSRKFRRELRAITSKHNFIMTGGSDYHGAIRPGTTLAGGKNVYVADYLLEELEKRALSIQGKF